VGYSVVTWFGMHFITAEADPLLHVAKWNWVLELVFYLLIGFLGLLGVICGPCGLVDPIPNNEDK
jgi:hypothetical protein